LRASFDRWWASLAGSVEENEAVVGPALNPFAELYWKQFGGGPSQEDRRRMDGKRAFDFEGARAPKN
jgi:arylsulfatase